jgi:mono/diheme cytochrome c family protein
MNESRLPLRHRPLSLSLVLLLAGAFTAAEIAACSDPPAPPAPDGAAGTGGSAPATGTGGHMNAGGSTAAGGSHATGGSSAGGSSAGGSSAGGSSAGGSSAGGTTGAGGSGGTSGLDAGGPPPGNDGGSVLPPPGATPAMVYALTCSPCHGADGAGTKLGPEIKHPPRDLIAWAVRQGREGKGFPAPMLAYTTAQVSDAALAGIVELLWAQPRPTDAQGLYLDFCGNCHGPDGKGGSVAEVAFGKRATEIDDIVRAGHGVTNLANRPKYMPAFSTTDLPDADLTMIKTFLNAR